ncbi:hypothetical protein MMC25_007489 [Agyrium rufum]|nr:hypothetical protein [Agyrium rufum]
MLADRCLQHADANVRFFGASTFTIKINTDKEYLQQEGDQVLDRLMSWVTHCLQAQETHLVLSKLSASLTAYFVHPGVVWKRPVQDLARRTAASKSASAIPPGLAFTDLLHYLENREIRFLLTFIDDLYSAGKRLIGLGHTQVAKTLQGFQEQLHESFEDFVELVHYVSASQEKFEDRIVWYTLPAFNAIIAYVNFHSVSGAAAASKLRTLTPLYMGIMFNHDGYMFVSEIFQDILRDSYSFLTENDYEQLEIFLCGEKTEGAMKQIQNGMYDDDEITIGYLLLAYGESKLSVLMRMETPMHIEILTRLLRLLQCKGWPGEDDDVICSKALEFWQSFVSELLDMVAKQPSSWIPNTIEFLRQPVEAVWTKLKWPSPKEEEGWDSEAKDMQNTFRNDAADFMQDAAGLPNFHLLQGFIHSAFQFLERQAWMDLEATLFCVKALTEVFSQQEGHEQLDALLSAPGFTHLLSSEIEIPIKLQKSLIELFMSYTNFFERHSQFLPQTLTFLFRAVRSQSLGLYASRAISELAATFPKDLVVHIDGFMTQWSEITDLDVKGRLLEAIGSLIQMLQPESEQVRAIGVLTEYLEREVATCRLILSRGAVVEGQQSGLHVLHCMHRLAKGLQAPDDTIIDLDKVRTLTSVWSRHEGQGMQGRILGCFLHVYDLLKADGEVVEAACDVLRDGYVESIPGPFVFPPQITQQILTSCPLTSNRLVYVIETAVILFGRSQPKNLAGILETAIGCLGYIVSLLQSMNGNPSHEPVAAASCLTFTEKTIERYSDAYVDPAIQQEAPMLFNFASACLTSAEILPKRAACSLWATVIRQYTDGDETQKALSSWATKVYGPLLSEALVKQIGGGCARSELDELSSPLKELVGKHPSAKDWLSQALANLVPESGAVSDQAKRTWLLKIMKYGNRSTSSSWIPG